MRSSRVLIPVVLLGKKHASEGTVVAAVPIGLLDGFSYALKFSSCFGELTVVDQLEVTDGECLGKGHWVNASFFLRLLRLLPSHFR